MHALQPFFCTQDTIDFVGDWNWILLIVGFERARVNPDCFRQALLQTFGFARYKFLRNPASPLDVSILEQRLDHTRSYERELLFGRKNHDYYPWGSLLHSIKIATESVTGSLLVRKTNLSSFEPFSRIVLAELHLC